VNKEEEHERGCEEDLPFLDGEDPATPYPEDVEHWVSVYQQLVSFCEWLLATPPRSPEEAEQANLVRSRLDRALRRLSYWRSRLGRHVESRDRPRGEGA
jgi:hypothetical protein